MALGWKARAGLVLSAVWLCLIFLITDGERRLGPVLGFGVLPLLVIWGAGWAIAGWRRERLVRAPLTPNELDAKNRRQARLPTVIAVIVILALGVFSATWQFHIADDEPAGRAVAYWFGEWMVYGLIAFALLRFIPKLPTGAPAVLAALVVVGAVNVKSYTSITETRQALASLAKATPLMMKVQGGAPVTDQEVRDANVGLFEPLILAQATYGRDVLTATTTYQTAIARLQPELMLTPASLASPSVRLQTRMRIAMWRQATEEYQTQLHAATSRAKLAFQASLSQLPQPVSIGARDGFDNMSRVFSEYVSNLVATEKDAQGAVVALLDLMDSNQGGYVVDKGPPPNLLFRDAATLALYRKHMGTMLAASERQQEGQARLVRANAELTERTGELFRRR